ncbi:MAG: endopeptidase La [Pseudomonadota bacterium]
MTEKQQLPILPLRDVVIFPNMVMPLFVGRPKSIKALEAGLAQGGKKILLVAQKNSDVENPEEKDLYQVGTQAAILQLLKLPDGTVKVLIEGEQRIAIEKFIQHDDYLMAEVSVLTPILKSDKKSEHELKIMMRSVLSLFDEYVKFDKKTPPEVFNSLNGIDDPSRLSDMITAHLNLKIEDKQSILQTVDIKARLERLVSLIQGEIDLLKVEERLRGRIEKQMKKSQREYYLNEQIKAIQKELGNADKTEDEIETLKKKISKSGMPKEAHDKAMSELNKLKMMPSMSAEATVSRNYLDYLIAVPWKQQSKVVINLTKAQKILDEQHYGLEKIKERFIEYLAVQQRTKKIKGSILCLVGPPGVGKTSLGQSVAQATGREFVRVSLGGVRDEAEIRGHRRTYIGSMPGKIIQKLSKVGVNNPLFMLDEIDKMAMDFRGDPASALLEVLDPEQNHAFNDHYLEVDFDLSSVMFIATANTLDIPPALLDRMEVIRLSGYTEDEKIHIALDHLLDKQLEANGLEKKELSLSPEALREIIRYYTREAGVRNLEREISKICRKAVKKLTSNKRMKSVKVTPENMNEFLGVQLYRYGLADKVDQIGQVTGLAWTEVGGELLRIEATAVPGKGKVIFTGQLGEVMQESIQAAMTVVRARLKTFGMRDDDKYFEEHDIHIHLPEGAIPKDGPSAGIGMCTALASIVAQVPIRADLAMTGEITLRGEILPIGGLKEKLLAALGGGIKEVLIPEENVKDLEEIPDNVKKGLKISAVQRIDQVFDKAFSQPVKAASSSKRRATKTKASTKKKTGTVKSKKRS